MTCGIKMTGKSPCRNASQGGTKVRLEQSGQIIINFCKVILCELKVHSCGRVVRQLIAKSHTLLRW